jgi:hypothetical protein
MGQLCLQARPSSMGLQARAMSLSQVGLLPRIIGPVLHTVVCQFDQLSLSASHVKFVRGSPKKHAMMIAHTFPASGTCARLCMQ